MQNDIGMYQENINTLVDKKCFTSGFLDLFNADRTFELKIGSTVCSLRRNNARF